MLIWIKWPRTNVFFLDELCIFTYAVSVFVFLLFYMKGFLWLSYCVLYITYLKQIYVDTLPKKHGFASECYCDIMRKIIDWWCTKYITFTDKIIKRKTRLQITSEECYWKFCCAGFYTTKDFFFLLYVIHFIIQWSVRDLIQY